MPSKNRVRYAVVGLGHFAQSAIIPAFAHAKNAQLVAFVSGNKEKRETLARRYQVPIVATYHHYDELLESGDIDAVYIALPNFMHCDFAVRAANAGVHVLCEKPLAVTVKECQQMISAARRNRVKLMCAYRLHFERTTLTAAEVVRSGRLGDPKLFSSTFTQMVDPANTRFKPAHVGGGPIYDVGVYCLNAVRTMFGDEPTEVSCFVSPKNLRKGAVEEQATVMLRFPDDKLATFGVSFVAHHDSRFEVIGEKGMLAQNPAYQHAEGLAQEITVGERTQKQFFPKRDQVAAEIVEFSTCVLNDREPEASGDEGLRDIRVIEAMFKSARSGRVVQLPKLAAKKHKPTMRQERRLAPHREAKTIDVAPPRK